MGRPHLAVVVEAELPPVPLATALAPVLVLALPPPPTARRAAANTILTVAREGPARPGHHPHPWAPWANWSFYFGVYYSGRQK
jgi:hypothetical protein